MPFAVGVKFDPDQFAQFFKTAAEMPLAENDFCVVQDKEGQDRVGYVSCFEGRSPDQMDRLPAVNRRAKGEEISRWHECCRRSRQALALVRQKVIEHNLPMKVNSVVFNDYQNEILFYFSADRRIDFRELVRDLAGLLKARIELWQIGSRRAAAEQDGFGHCGQRLCCASWMKSFPAVSIRHAREQDINQAPPKLSGFCGRLRCCMRFEHDAYCDLREGAPMVGAQVRTADGREGKVYDRNLIRHEAWVALANEKPQWMTFDKLTIIAQAAEAIHAQLGPEVEEEDMVIREEE